MSASYSLELINLRDDEGQGNSSKPAVKIENDQKTVLACRDLGGNQVEVWSDCEKAYQMLTRNSNGLGTLSVGRFYKIETLPSGMVESSPIPDICDVNILKKPKGNVVIFARVPIFIGNQLKEGREFICYSEFFGRVYYDASYSAVKVEQFKTYMCVLKSIQKSQFECHWKVSQLLCVHRPPLRYYLLEVNIENIHENGEIVCERSGIQVDLRREDLRENCYEDLIQYLVIYVVAFKNQPYLSQCRMYRSCFATLIDDFTSDLYKNALVPAEMAQRRCDEKTKRRAMIIAKLMHDERFIEEFLSLNPTLRDNLFKFMITGGCSQPTYNNENLLL